MASKLGIHVNVPTDEDRFVEFCRVARPAAILHLDLGNTPFARRVRAVSPETLIVGRKWFSSQSLTNPEGKADDAAGSILGSSCAREGLIDTFVGYNEIGPHPTHDYMRFQVRLAQRLHDAGMKYGAGSWSVGCPAIEDWESNWIREVLRVSDYIAVHEYCAPRMDDARGLDAAKPGEGWFTLRYRKWYPDLPSDCKKPLLITECGIDSGAAHWDPAAQGGWRSFTTPQGYLDQLKWYDGHLQADDYVLGAMIFCCGTHDPTWDTFDVKGEMLDLLQNYLVEEQEAGDVVVPYPDWLIDMRATLPRAGEYGVRAGGLDAVRRVVIHHSDAPVTVGPWQIAEYHSAPEPAGKGWPGHGYHADVAVDGRVWHCQDWDRHSYHAGPANGDSIGVCLLGSFMGGSEPPESQLEATRNLIDHLEQVVGRELEVVGHREVMDDRECPGDTFLGPGGWKERLLGEAEFDWRVEADRLSGLLADVEEIAKER